VSVGKLARIQVNAVRPVLLLSSGKKRDKLLADQRYRTSHCGLGDHQIRLRRIDSSLFDCHLYAIRLRVEFYEEVAFFDAIIVIDEDTLHLRAQVA
jgi:hypothetical protein